MNPEPTLFSERKAAAGGSAFTPIKPASWSFAGLQQRTANNAGRGTGDVRIPEFYPLLHHNPAMAFAAWSETDCYAG